MMFPLTLIAILAVAIIVGIISYYLGLKNALKKMEGSVHVHWRRIRVGYQNFLSAILSIVTFLGVFEVLLLKAFPALQVYAGSFVGAIAFVLLIGLCWLLGRRSEIIEKAEQQVG